MTPSESTVVKAIQNEDVCGIDTGGTFTDLVLIGPGGLVGVLKTPSTRPNFEHGVLEALERAADLSSQVGFVAHGTTVGTNAVLEGNTAVVAMVTTAGCGDLVFQMRGSGRVAGLPDELIGRVHETSKPEPIVERQHIFEIGERIDSRGEVVVALDADEVRGVARQIAQLGIGAVAICLLWSFRNPRHEQEVAAILREILPTVHVSLSSEVAPRWGEYERFVATILNASLAPVMTGYLNRLESQLEAARRRLYVMQCNGGTISAAEAIRLPLQTLNSGPVGGIVACQALGRATGRNNIIATDMGGTSFDVGIVEGGYPLTNRTGVVRQYEYFVSTVMVESIGAGGGSIAYLDATANNLRVGPRSAGAAPGPACYDRGGTEPTVTDADLVLGRLPQEGALGGAIHLRRDLAERAIATIADRLGMSTAETAAGIVAIIDNRMADLIRATTVRRGLDPRDFVLFAYGGAGPCHVGGYAAELGCDAVIPLGNVASVWSAYGIAQSDVARVFEQNVMRRLPIPIDILREVIERLEQRAVTEVEEQGVLLDSLVLQREVDIRFRGQVYELAIGLPSGQLQEADLEQLPERFLLRYEQVYGQGAGFPGASLELVSIRIRATGSVHSRSRMPSERLAVEPFHPRPSALRSVFWTPVTGYIDSPVFGPSDLRPGAQVLGPAVCDLPDTTICVHPDQILAVDKTGSMVLRQQATQ